MGDDQSYLLKFFLLYLGNSRNRVLFNYLVSRTLLGIGWESAFADQKTSKVFGIFQKKKGDYLNMTRILFMLMYSAKATEFSQRSIQRATIVSLH